MQRTPSISMPIRVGDTERTNGISKHQNDTAQNNAAASPLLLLARRIRDEQGVEQLRAFLDAMAPYAAPNELKSVGAGFGIEYDGSKSIPNDKMPSGNDHNTNRREDNNGNGMNRMQMLQRLMLMQNLISGQGGKTDVSSLINMLGSMN